MGAREPELLSWEEAKHPEDVSPAEWISKRGARWRPPKPAPQTVKRDMRKQGGVK